MTVIDEHAPMKRKIVRHGQVPYMNAELRKAINNRNMWRSKHFKNKLDKSCRDNYVRWRNKVVKLSRVSTQNYFEKRCTNHMYKREFYNTVKPFMSDKNSRNNCANIALSEDGKIVTDPVQIAEIFNKFYASVATYDIMNDGLDDKHLSQVLDLHKCHESVKNIQTQMLSRPDRFSFSVLQTDTMLKYINNLETGKSAGHDHIHTKFVKIAGKQLSQTLCSMFNTCVQESVFPTDLKMSEISPVFKKNDNLCKNNYRSVNVLTIFSKLFEKVIADQLTEFFCHILNPGISAYRKGYSCQHVILYLTEYWRKALDNGDHVGTIAMDLSKAFDRMPHGLLISKLHAYGLSDRACQLLMSYLTNRLQRVKIKDTHSDWSIINRGVPQGSVLGPLLFNIFINDLFYLNIEGVIANYADDNHVVNRNRDIHMLQISLEQDTSKIVEWFSHNDMDANPDKFQGIILSRSSQANEKLFVNGNEIAMTDIIKVLGVTLDKNLKFDIHIRNLCTSASRQLNALKRISKFLNLSCRLQIYTAFISAHFGYCPVVWIFCGKKNMQKLEKLQERALRFIYSDSDASYSDLLTRGNMLSITMTCLKYLAVEVYKCVRGNNPEYLNEMFIPPVQNYDFRDEDRLAQPHFMTYRYGYKSFRYYGAKLWNSLPPHVKAADSIYAFKENVSQWCTTPDAQALVIC